MVIPMSFKIPMFVGDDKNEKILPLPKGPQSDRVTRPIDILTRWRREGIVDVHVSIQDLKRWRREMEHEVKKKITWQEFVDRIQFTLLQIRKNGHLISGPRLSLPLGKGYKYHIETQGWINLFPPPIVDGQDVLNWKNVPVRAVHRV